MASEDFTREDLEEALRAITSTIIGESQNAHRSDCRAVTARAPHTLHTTSRPPDVIDAACTKSCVDFESRSYVTTFAVDGGIGTLVSQWSQTRLSVPGLNAVGAPHCGHG